MKNVLYGRGFILTCGKCGSEADLEVSGEFDATRNKAYASFDIKCQRCDGRLGSAIGIPQPNYKEQ